MTRSYSYSVTAFFHLAPPNSLHYSSTDEYGQLPDSTAD